MLGFARPTQRCIDVLGLNRREALNSIDLLGYNKLKSTQPNKSITNLNKEGEAMSTNSERRVDPNLNEKEWQQVKPYDESAKV